MSGNLPKRPRTPFFRFLEDQRPILRQQNPNWNARAIMNTIGKMWENLSVEQSQSYEKLYEEDMAVYRRTLNERQLQTLTSTS